MGMAIFHNKITIQLRTAFIKMEMKKEMVLPEMQDRLVMGQLLKIYVR